MKKKFEMPDVDLIKFTTEDVLTESVGNPGTGEDDVVSNPGIWDNEGEEF